MGLKTWFELLIVGMVSVLLFSDTLSDAVSAKCYSRKKEQKNSVVILKRTAKDIDM